MVEKKKATASNPTVEQQLTQALIEKNELSKALSVALDEVKSLKNQLTEANTVIETDLKSDVMARIKSRSDFTNAELERLNIEQLQQIDATLSKVKGAAQPTYKHIRTGDDTSTGRTTVGSLFGKTREEILKMGGDF